jgi:energy-coupling factor transport system ATP-binding protein
MQESIVSFKDVSFTYPNGVEALKNINLKIETDSLMAIIGENGSGKTTLAKLANGLLKPTTGSVIINGTDAKEKQAFELAREVGYVFQNPSHQLFNGSVKEELSVGPRILGLPVDEVNQRINEASEIFKLDEFLEFNPQDLPFPEKKMVAIASVFTMKPRVMILDEPTTGQDHIGLELVKNTVKKLSALGMTLVMISHDMRLVAETATRIVVMAHANIIADGEAGEIFTNAPVMAEARIRPPQVVELGLALQREYSGHGPPCLTTDEEIVSLKSVIGAKGHWSN